MAAIVQLEATDRLPVTAIEAFGQPQDRGQRPHDAPRAATEVAETLVAALGSGLTMIPRHERDDLHFFRLEAAQITVLDQIVRMFVVSFVADVHADVVEDGRVLQPRAFAIGQAVDGARLVEQRRRQPRHLLRVFGPVVAPLGQLDDAALADVRIPIRLRNFFSVLRDVIEDQPFSE